MLDGLKNTLKKWKFRLIFKVFHKNKRTRPIFVRALLYQAVRVNSNIFLMSICPYLGQIFILYRVRI